MELNDESNFYPETANSTNDTSDSYFYKSDFNSSYDSINFTYTDPKNYTTNSELNAFRYTDADYINSFPFVGQLSTYMGGGYVYKLFLDDLNQTKYGLNYLESSNWIDRYTRAVFVEFSVYNPNINLFAYCFILYEILPTGNFLQRAYFLPVKLYNIKTPKEFLSLDVLFFLIYLILVIVFMISQFRYIYLNGRKYFFEFYSYINLTIIVFSWIGFGMFINKFVETAKLFKQINQSKSNDSFINLQYVSNLDDYITVSFGMCAMLSTIRILKMINFNRTIKIFLNTFRDSLKEFFFYLVFFFVIWLSFIQIFYLIFNESSSQFSTFLKSLEVCFQILLGKFQVDYLFGHNKIMGCIIFVFYNIMVSFILISLFLSILMFYFNEDRFDPRFSQEQSELSQYFKELILQFVNIFRKDDEAKIDEYKYLPNDIELLESHIDRLLYLFNKVSYVESA